MSGWKAAGMVLCSDPTIAASPDWVFDPSAQTTPESNWMIDFSSIGIDHHGWTYAYDFPTLNNTGTGEAKGWNCIVRRRKWRRRGAQNSRKKKIRNFISLRNDNETNVYDPRKRLE